jgi:hypothetical protein
MVTGQAPLSPTDPRTSRDFDRYGWAWGLTASTSLPRDVGLYASFFQSRDVQDYDLVTSERPGGNPNGQRYFQDLNFIDFRLNNEPVEYHTNDLSVVAGSTWQATRQTDLGLSYAFTQAQTTYESVLTGDLTQINANIHRVYCDVGHWVMEGLRVSAGYRFDLYDDGSRVPQPIDYSTTQHTISVGVTLTNDLFSGG